MKRSVAILAVLFTTGCSDLHSPVAATTPAVGVTTVTPSAPPNALRGTVTDGSGQPLAGALVEWTGAVEMWGDRGDGVATNQNGEYRFAIGSLPPGGYAVARVTKSGYDPQTKSVQISGDTVLNFTVARFSANGTVTWVSATRAQPLCPEIAAQVGKTYPLWLVMKSDGTSVTVTLSHDQPPTDDPSSGSIVFTGTRSGDEIAGAYETPGVPFGCSTDTTVTAYGVRGVLRAAVSGNHISGQYTTVYGTGDSQVTFVFQFQASV